MYVCWNALYPLEIMEKKSRNRKVRAANIAVAPKILKRRSAR